jgi:hypothetical protein
MYFPPLSSLSFSVSVSLSLSLSLTLSLSSTLQILRVMGLVMSVRQKQKKSKSSSSHAHTPLESDTVSLHTIANSIPSALSTLQDPSATVPSLSGGPSEVSYTMIGHARGPNVPLGILTGLSKDMTERSKRHQETLQRIESLQVPVSIPVSHKHADISLSLSVSHTDSTHSN